MNQAAQTAERGWVELLITYMFITDCLTAKNYRLLTAAIAEK